MNPWDIFIMIVGLMLVLFGAVKGVVRIVAGLGSLVVAFVLASWFDGVAGALLSAFIESDEWRRLAGFALVFIGVIAAGILVGWFVSRALDKASLRWIDRLVGAGIGLLATAMLFGALLIPAVAYLPRGGTLLEESRLAPYAVSVSQFVKGVVPAEARSRFNERMEILRKAWDRSTTGE